MDSAAQPVRTEGLQRFRSLESEAIAAVTERLYDAHGSVYAQYGCRGREVCHNDLAFHLEFLRPVLEFGLQQQMVDYLVWLGSLLESRAVPSSHLALSLDWLGEFFAARMDAADGTVVAAALQQAREGFESAVELPVVAPLPRMPWSDTAAFEAALLAGRHREALTAVKRCIDEGHSLVEVEMNMIQPALYDIGTKWQLNQVSIAQEHLATAIAHSVMTIGLLGSPVPAMNAHRVLVACVQGNNHVVGARMVCDAFQLAGWDVQFLGADTPTPALVGHATEWKPDLIGLSVSFPQQLPAAKDVIARLRERFGSVRPPVLLGGLAINRFPHLAEMVGADAHSPDPQEAVAYADRSVGLGGPGALVST
jgi:MerR family transcriptional regulator, light-induced transcriptional regulator